jgi:hypothetical protein
LVQLPVVKLAKVSAGIIEEANQVSERDMGWCRPNRSIQLEVPLRLGHLVVEDVSHPLLEG